MYNTLNDLVTFGIELGPATEESCFCSKHEMLFYVIHGILYFIPWTKSAVEVLSHNKFKREDLQIHYDYYNVILTKKKDWNLLIKKARIEEMPT